MASGYSLHFWSLRRFGNFGLCSYYEYDYFFLNFFILIAYFLKLVGIMHMERQQDMLLPTPPLGFGLFLGLEQLVDGACGGAHYVDKVELGPHQSIDPSSKP